MASGIDAFTLSFYDIPEDAQVCILSFLTPLEISSFACTSKHFASMCRDEGKLWHAMCDRRWGKKTQIQKWGRGRIGYRLLYKALSEWENLIGFWRRCGRANPAVSSPSLVFFEWGSSFVLGSRVSPAESGTYQVTKTPFLWMSLSSEGQIVNFLDLDGNLGPAIDFEDLGFSNGNFIQVDVNFIGNCHFTVEANRCFIYNPRGVSKSPISKSPISMSPNSGDEIEQVITGKSSNVVVSEIYTQLANRTSPGGDKRRNRRKEKTRIVWEAEHFVKVVDCSPTSSKPLQGLWKGLCEESNLGFYYVKYDEVGGIICKKVEDSSSFSSSSSSSSSPSMSPGSVPVFWTSNPSCVEEGDNKGEGVVSRVMCMKSNGKGKGKIWIYGDGTFGFGFLGDQVIVDLKPVVDLHHHHTHHACRLADQS